MLSLWQWFAIVITVAGAVLISLQMDGSGRKARLQKSFFILLLVALMLAVASIGFKYALQSMSFWNTLSTSTLCVVVVFLIYALRKKTFSELKNLPQLPQKMAILLGNQWFAVFGVVMSFIAIANGPVALVSTIMNIRPAFVFVFSLILSRFYPNFINERLDRRTILIKLFGIVLITGGVAIIGLFN
jgi:drug/metabolite transporter (DMT)-like permease